MDGHSSDRVTNPCILIELNCGAVLGKKRVLLLEGIGRFESLERAAEAADIPFDHALELVNTMNDGCDGPLVDILSEKGDDVRAWLTLAGEEAVQDFKQLYEDLKSAVNEELSFRRSA